MTDSQQVPLSILQRVFGTWLAPPWVSALVTVLSQQKKFIVTMLVSALILLITYIYQENLPEPLSIEAKVRAPQVLHDDATSPDALRINFTYDPNTITAKNKPDRDFPSAARLDLIGKAVESGIHLKPSIPGTWQWQNEHQLVFEPKVHWPPNVSYQVEYQKTIFADKLHLTTASSEFTTHPFTAHIDKLEFYQSPKDINERQMVATLRFSHPVEPAAIKQAISMLFRDPKGAIDSSKSVLNYSLELASNQRVAYLRSDNLQLPNQSTYLTLAINSKAKSLLGGKSLGTEVSAKVLIPDRYSYLKIDDLSVQIVRNENDEPEQVLSIGFTDQINESVLRKKISLYQLPQKGQPFGKRHWSASGQVTSDVLKNAKVLPLRQIANQRGSANRFNFVFDADEKAYLYFRLDAGLVSVNDFVKQSMEDKIMRSPHYPLEIKIAGEGAVLSASGEKKLVFMTRGLDAVEVTVGRLLNGQINHLLSQSSGSIITPNFDNWRFNHENISSISRKIIDFPPLEKKQANYGSFDLSPYLGDEKAQFGVFFVELFAWDRKSKRRIYGPTDRRLIHLTDLSMILKKNQDNSHELFVMSLLDGKPQENVAVELLGKNGVPLLTRYTSERGHVTFPNTSEFKQEKKPVVYVARTAADVTYIPFSGRSRQINYSRFDIGGRYHHRGPQKGLRAFIFSERGIYRPGDTVNLGSVVKGENIKNVDGIPLEVVIRGPRGNTVDNKKIALPEFGFFDHQFTTTATSNTGDYTVAVHLIENGYRRRSLGSASFKVEEFQPDTMKIESRFQGITNKGWVNSSALGAKITLKNLFGIPAQNRKVTGRIKISPTRFSFREYRDYQFIDPQAEDAPLLKVDEKLPDKATDSSGVAEYALDLSRFARGTYRLNVVFEGFDAGGGRSVVSQNSALISPLEHIVGFKADGKLDYLHLNSKRELSFIVLNHKLNKVAAKDLQLTVIELKNTSTLVRQKDGTYRYETIIKEKPIEADVLSIKDGLATLQLNTSQAGRYALVLKDDNNHPLARVQYQVIGSQNISGALADHADLNVILNKTDYQVGEVIAMQISAPYKGAGLITIESDRVHAFSWFKSDTKVSQQYIQIPNELEGNAYVNVTYARDIGSNKIFSQPLSYAVQAFSIDKSQRKVSVNLAVPKIARPGKAMSIGYSSSRPSKIAVFAVDEGILQVANYKKPDPLAFFYQKKALSVSTLQMLDLLLPEFKWYKALSASGGGASAMREGLAKNLNPFARKVDKPAVFWSGIINADPQQRNVNFTIPDTFSGQLRVMAVAVAENAVGSASESSLVRGPFVISPNVLTQAAPGDSFIVSASIANIIEGSGKALPVQVRLESTPHFDIVGEQKAALTIDEGSEAKVTFRVKVKEKLGNGDLIFKVDAKNEQAKRTASVSIRPAVPYLSTFAAGFAESLQHQINVSRKLRSELAEQKISASASPLVLVDGLSSYLKHFPHGCTEQVVSKVFPLIGLMGHSAYGSHLGDVKVYFSQVIKKLRQRQVGNGGFAFWPGHTRDADFPTIYALHFLIEARDLGYPVPRDMLNRGKQYLLSYVQRQSADEFSALKRANAIYLLTRLGEVTTNHLVDLHEYLEQHHKQQWRSAMHSVYIAASYQLLGKEQEASSLVKTYALFDDDKKVFSDFHSALMQDAQTVYLLVKHFPKQAKGLAGQDLLRFIQPLIQGQYNTISAAYTMLALGAYSQLVVEPQSDQTLDFSAYKEQQWLPLETVKQPFSHALYATDIDKIGIKATQSQFFLNVQSGYDQALPIKALRSKLEIIREFINDDGNTVNEARQGDELTVRLRIRSLDGKNHTNIAVLDLLPGGFEILRNSVARKVGHWGADYIDVREDRIVYYGQFGSQMRELNYRVKLTAAGDFVVPPSLAESMYNREVRAVSLPERFIVRP